MLPTAKPFVYKPEFPLDYLIEPILRFSLDLDLGLPAVYLPVVFIELYLLLSARALEFVFDWLFIKDEGMTLVMELC